MQGRGVLGTLRSAVRRLASVPGSIQATVAAVVVAGVFIGAVPNASATPFSYTGGLVDYTVPATGVYEIQATGAGGGAGAVPGGLGSQVSGDFNLTAGETLVIAVGGAGASGSQAGGGGGGSFVVGPGNTELAVAGGGGGGGNGVGGGDGGIGGGGGGGLGGNGLPGVQFPLLPGATPPPPPTSPGGGGSGFGSGLGGGSGGIGGGNGGFGGGGGGGTVAVLTGYSLDPVTHLPIFATYAVSGGGGGGGGSIFGGFGDGGGSSGILGASFDGGTNPVVTGGVNAGNGSVVITPSQNYLYVQLAVSGQKTIISANAYVSPTLFPSSVLQSTGTYLVASLPSNDNTLALAARFEGGYTGFDWVQQVTSTTYPVLANGASGPYLLGAPPPFFDPPPLGYNYCATTNACPPNWQTSSPFYYSPLNLSPNSLTPFYDSPVNLPLGSKTFTTELVGYTTCNTPGQFGCNVEGFSAGPPLFTWDWSDNYSLGLGGVNCPLCNITLSDVPAPPGGTGGITITEINGAPVPEPSSTAALLLIGFAGLGWFRRRAFHPAHAHDVQRRVKSLTKNQRAEIYSVQWDLHRAKNPFMLTQRAGCGRFSPNHTAIAAAIVKSSWSFSRSAANVSLPAPVTRTVKL
jgi:hypothetical protein